MGRDVDAPERDQTCRGREGVIVAPVHRHGLRSRAERPRRRCDRHCRRIVTRTAIEADALRCHHRRRRAVGLHRRVRLRGGVRGLGPRRRRRGDADNGNETQHHEHMRWATRMENATDCRRELPPPGRCNRVPASERIGGAPYTFRAWQRRCLTDWPCISCVARAASDIHTFRSATGNSCEKCAKRQAIGLTLGVAHRRTIRAQPPEM